MDKMKNRQILDNYNQLKSFIVKKLNSLHNYSEFYQNELVETIMSDEKIIQLLTVSNLEAKAHELDILTAINESQNWIKSLNHNFKELSLDLMNESYGYELEQIESNEETDAPTSIDDFRSYDLSEFNKKYLNQLCQELNERQKEYILSNLGMNSNQINKTIQFIADLFPEIPTTIPDSSDSSQLKKSEIINIYKHVLIGTVPRFPPLFLQINAEQKIKLLLEFLRDHILKVSTKQFFSDFDVDVMYQYKLANCARYVNYSWNRLIQILEPEQFLPWQLGKVTEGYWNNKNNRIFAVKWLIEDYFNIKPNQIWKLINSKRLNRETFGKLGLSYLYNTYYNSLLKCIQETYTELNYWQIGIYPNGFWENEQAKEYGKDAFIWMLGEEGIQEDQLIKAVEIKWINRKLFSKYKLSTMFDYCFNKNLFDLVDFSFPNQFKPWELGNVRNSYWDKSENHSKAIHYFLKEIQQTEFDLEKMLQNNSFKRSQLKQSKLANFFKNYYNNNPDKIFFKLLKPLRLVREGNYRIYNKLKRINKQQNDSKLMKIMKHGINYHLVENFEREQKKRIARKLRSRKYILEQED